MGLLSDMQRSSEARVRDARSRVPEAKMRSMAVAAAAPPRLAFHALGFDMIAELKLRSPSAGDLSSRTTDPLNRLEGYARGGAAIVSVLTEPERFDGHLDHLRQAADLLRPYGVPAMRKDFLVDPYQVVEARLHGASGVLLIVRLVGRARLVEMIDCAKELGLFVLLEAFDEHDLDVAAGIAEERATGTSASAQRSAPAQPGLSTWQGASTQSSASLPRDEQVLMGLNCRDLETLAIDFGRFARLRERLPPQWPAVAESGVITTEDARRVAELGYRFALVGTSLMRRDDATAAVADLLTAGRLAARNRADAPVPGDPAADDQPISR